MGRFLAEASFHVAPLLNTDLLQNEMDSLLGLLTSLTFANANPDPEFFYFWAVLCYNVCGICENRGNSILLKCSALHAYLEDRLSDHGMFK